MSKLLSLSFFQGLTIPIWGVLLVLIGFLAPNHDSMSQHLSVIGLQTGMWPALLQAASIGLGLSICIFSISSSFVLRKFAWLTLPSFAFGIAMIFNGLYKTGSPMHGLYGMAFFSPLVPVMFVFDFKDKIYSKSFWVFSNITAIAAMIYMWLMLTQLDPHGYIGLTQRAFILLLTMWYGVGVYLLWSPKR